jgi:hypothetical protein
MYPKSLNKFQSDRRRILKIKTADTTLANASRASFENGKIVVDIVGCSYSNASRGVTIGGLPYPLRVIDATYLVKTSVAAAVRVYNCSKIAASYLMLSIGSNVAANVPGTIKYINASGGANIITGSQIGLAGKLNDGRGTLVLYCEPY